MASTVRNTKLRTDLQHFKSMLIFCKLLTKKRDWAGYRKVIEYKTTWRALYKALRNEYISGNRAGIIFQGVMHVYYDCNVDLLKEIKPYSAIKKPRGVAMKLVINREFNALYKQEVKVIRNWDDEIRNDDELNNVNFN